MEVSHDNKGREPGNATEAVDEVNSSTASHDPNSPAVSDGVVEQTEDDPPITEDVVIEARQEALRVAQSVMAWQAPLPMPDDYRAYKEIDPELAAEIKATYSDQTALMRTIATTEQSFTSRELDIAEREQ